MVKASSSQPAELARELKQLRTELTILSRVRHPNVVRLFGGSLSPPTFFLVEELMEVGGWVGTTVTCDGWRAARCCVPRQACDLRFPQHTRVQVPIQVHQAAFQSLAVKQVAIRGRLQ